MHTQEEEPAFTESDYTDRPAKPLVNTGEESEVLQNGHSNSLEPLASPLDEIENNASRKPEETKPVVSGAMHFQSTSISIWKFVLPILLAYLVFPVLPNAIPGLLPGVSCNLPFFSWHSSHCARDLEPVVKPPIIPNFVTLARLQTRLEYVMEDSARNSLVAVNIKCSEIALRDLIALVKLSSLARKDTLEQNLKHFVKDAKATSGSLQEFGSRVWTAVDRIVSLNEHTVIMLESGKSSETPCGYFCGLANFLLSNEQEAAATRRKMIEDLWPQSRELLAKTLRELTRQAQKNVGSLDRLKEKLDNIQDILVEEEDELRREEQKKEREWFKEFKEAFGTSQEKRQSHSASRELLRTIYDERQHALDYTTGVLFRLEQMSRDLDSLRTEVVESIITVGSPNVPIEVHIGSIQEGIERLSHGQIRMKEIENTSLWKTFCPK